MTIHSIPGYLEVTWNADVRAIIDIWTDYGVTLDMFREAVLGLGLDHAKANNGQAWIVDSSGSTGVFSQEIQSFIASDVFRLFTENGIQHFITVPPEDMLTRLTVAQYISLAGPHGINLVEVASVEDAIIWLNEHAQ